MSEQHQSVGVDDETEDEGFDVEALKDRIGFLLRAPRRRPKLAAFVFLVIAVLGVTVSMTMPRTYSAQVKLLAQRNSIMMPILDPGQGNGDESPTKNVAEVILRRDNLIALVKQADLVDRFEASRSPALRLKDRVVDSFSPPQTEEDRLRSLLFTLEKKMSILTDDSSITITIDWSDAEMAFELVTLVENNFLEAKYDSVVAMITDAIAILTEHSRTEAAQVDVALDEVARVQAARNTPSTTGGAATPRPLAAPSFQAPRRPSAGTTAPATAAAPDAALTAALEEKRRQIKLAEDDRARQLDGLKQQLANAQLTLTPLHPTVQALQQKVDALKETPPELVTLHAEERALMAQIVAATPAPVQAPQPSFAPAPSPSPGQTAAPEIPHAPVLVSPSFNEEDGPSRLARSKLEAAIHDYQDVMSRIDAAKLRLDINRAQFKYRYSVISPPEVPRKPKKPIATLVGVGSVVAALLLAILVAGLADIAAGRVIEPWQVRRSLKLDVLGELEPPA